jgi:hypothetical protein
MRAFASISPQRVPPIRSSTFVFVLFAGTLACSSPGEPGSGVTLLVSNATCDTGQCEAVHVYAFPDDQPLTPGGLWKLDLGTVSGESACFELPRSAKFTVTGTNTTTYEWTVDHLVALVGQLPSEPAIPASPSTPQFVPSTASGWSITLPGGAAPVVGEACAP